MQVTVSPRAWKQLAELVLWWRENRTAAADHLEQEFLRVLELLADHPRAGRVYQDDERYRTYPLKKTPYRMFYLIDEDAGVLEVDAIWSSMRGEGPPL